MGIVAAAAAAAVLALTGCGGGKPSATEQWQDSFCSALNQWVGEINGYADDIRTQLRSPNAGTVDQIKATIKKGEAATDQLRGKLRALGAPPVSDGETAKQLVDGLSADLQQSATRVRQQVTSIGAASSSVEALQAISAVAAEISLAVSQTKTTFQSLENLNTELANGFKTIGSCKDLKKRLE